MRFQIQTKSPDIVRYLAGQHGLLSAASLFVRRFEVIQDFAGRNQHEDSEFRSITHMEQ